MRILVTGGAGYIGSHTVLKLIESGAVVTVLDNFSNSSPVALERVSAMTGARIAVVHGDVCDAAALESAFSASSYDAVVHFAGLKAVGESTEQPLRYFRNNVSGTLNLLEAMAGSGVKTLVFSSSATVYGVPERVPIAEDAARAATNPYGRSKLIVEDILEDLCQADPGWRIARLRYFNPVGAHPSGALGEDPAGIPNNLMPFISQVAAGRRDKLSIFGGDYPTEDGTGVRDYIHVVDLADGHLAALAYLNGLGEGGLLTVNLGTGRGVSVLEVVRAFEEASGRKVPCEVVGRRAGDVAECYADPSLARELLGWSAKYGISDMCKDAWNWQSRNPDGYGAV